MAKHELAQATVTYLGKQVGHGQERPVDAKGTGILNFPTPSFRCVLQPFLGMSGYYCSFCKKMSTVVSSLTSLLSPSKPFVWTLDCQHAFNSVKALLYDAPVLAAPDFSRPFKLEVDASAVVAGAVLLQEDACRNDHPVSYFLHKFNKHQVQYSTIEQEALALLLALQFLEELMSVPVLCPLLCTQTITH